VHHTAVQPPTAAPPSASDDERSRWRRSACSSPEAEGRATGLEPRRAWTTARSQLRAPKPTDTGAQSSQTVSHWFAKSPCIPGNPRASLVAPPPEHRPICRAFFDLPKTQLLIAMQKVVGSSPISRFRSTCKSRCSGARSRSSRASARLGTNGRLVPNGIEPRPDPLIERSPRSEKGVSFCVVQTLTRARIDHTRRPLSIRSGRLVRRPVDARCSSIAEAPGTPKRGGPIAPALRVDAGREMASCPPNCHQLGLTPRG
jgi:hypothetical protein